MVKKLRTIPETGEFVVCKITRVNPFSVQVQLNDYPNIEGSIHISEVARKWIKDIREFAKEGQQSVALVLRVEADKNRADLSLKRVSKLEAATKLKEIKSEQRAEKMLEIAAKEIGVNLDDAYKEVGFKLQEGFGGLFNGFQAALSAQGKELLAKKGIPQKWIDAISSVAEKSMEVKEIELKARLELKSYAKDGVKIIKQVLEELEMKGVQIHYISAPKYALGLKTKDAKRGERIIAEAASAAIKKIEQSNGEGKFEMVKR